MKFEKGQEVTIRRNLGEKSGHGEFAYYYGGTIRGIRLGTKGVILNVYDEPGPIRLILQCKDNGQLYSFHPDELATPEEYSQYEKDKQEKLENRFNSFLDSVLLDNGGEIVEGESGTVNGQRKFEPKFNAKDEFVIWIREEFPELEKYAKNGGEYNALSKRAEEVVKAAELAWEGVEKASMTFYEGYGIGHGLYCQREFLGRWFNRFYDAEPKEDDKINLRRYAVALENLVRALELSGTNRFPYEEDSSYFRDFETLEDGEPKDKEERK